MAMQPARQGCGACCLPRAVSKEFSVGNMQRTPVERVASTFQKILEGMKLARYSLHKVKVSIEIFLFPDGTFNELLFICSFA